MDRQLDQLCRVARPSRQRGQLDDARRSLRASRVIGNAHCSPSRDAAAVAARCRPHRMAMASPSAAGHEGTRTVRTLCRGISVREALRLNPSCRPRRQGRWNSRAYCPLTAHRQWRVTMRASSSLIALAALAIAASASPAVQAQQSTQSTPNAQQERMKACNTQASSQKLTGDARKSFMSECARNRGRR